jgi:hypothetical protein
VLLQLFPLLAVAQEEDKWKEDWFFPDPFSLDRPVSPRRSGGGEIRFLTSSAGTALGLPASTDITTEKGDFIIQGFVPMVITIPDQGDASFGIGDPRISLKGSWKLEIPFSEDLIQPAAYSLGVDANIPLTAFFADAVETEDNPRAAYSHTVAGFGLFPESPVGWVPGYIGFSPRAAFAVGTPRLFFEAELSFPFLFPISYSHLYDTELFFIWGLACGTQPEESVAVMAELSGVVSLFQETAFNHTYEPNMFFATISTRVYLGPFTSGVMVRISAMDVYHGADSPWIMAGVFLGAELLR